MKTHYQTVILGGGLSGLIVAQKLQQNDPKHKYLIIEAQNTTGGVIRSHHDQGFITEMGPHGFLDNCEESQQVLKETGLAEECVKAPLIDFVRYVFLNNRLNLIPQTPGKIFKAPLIPWHAKLRVFADLWKPYLDGEPTVAKWANYRFGHALLPYLDAVYTGTYAGDFDRLTIDSVMPGVRRLEKEHGSVIRGLLAKRTANKKASNQAGDKKFTMPAMTSFTGGMRRLPEKLTELVKEKGELLLNTVATGIEQCSRGWLITTEAGNFTAENVVLALPINSGLKLLQKVATDIPEESVPETWIATVAFGFTEDVKLPPGFGFLTPEQEKRFALGTLFSSNMFPARAPDGHIVMETLVGGRRHPEKLELDDATLTKKAFADVRDILKIRKDPVYTKVLRSDGAIPQLERNYPALLRWKERFVEQNRGMHVCGFGWEGIGLNDMMKSATQIAQEILSKNKKDQITEVKGVYF